MTDGSMARDDRSLEAALRALSRDIDWPTSAPMTAEGTAAGPDIATRVRARLVAGERRRGPRWWSFGGRPVRRSLVLAIAALLALAIVAGALPEARIDWLVEARHREMVDWAAPRRERELAGDDGLAVAVVQGVLAEVLAHVIDQVAVAQGVP